MKRNPRRGYDAEGREIEPQTLAGMRDAMRCRSVEAICQACKHEAVVNCDMFPGTMYVPDVALALRCAECGSKDIRTKPNMAEFYANLPGGQGRHPNQK